MPDKPSKPLPRLSSKGKNAKSSREERLANLLRKNLKKRKSQQRRRDGNNDLS